MKSGFEKLESLMDWSVKTLTELQNNYTLVQVTYTKYEMIVEKPNMTIHFNDIYCYLNEQEHEECDFIEPEVNVSYFCKFVAYDNDGEDLEYNPTIQELKAMRVKFLELINYEYECKNLEL